MTSMYKISPTSDSQGDESSSSVSPADSILLPQPRRPHRYSLLKHKIRLLVRDTSAKHLTRRLIQSAILILLITSLAIVTWLALILTVANRLRIPTASNGLQQILKLYQAPTITSPATPTWLPDFSADILPVRCHAHNDYWHRVPLYEGLAAGCISTEADIWLGNLPDGTVELFVGHNKRSLTQSRTLRSLYLDPLFDILTQQNINVSTDSNSTFHTTQQALLPSTTDLTGVFSMSPNTSFTLLLDFKSNGPDLFPIVVSQLCSLRSAGFLTTWTPSTGIVQGPLTVVGTGNTPFDLVIANGTYRDVFFDAPLTSLVPANSVYNANNSYYASTSLSSSIGRIGSWRGLSAAQKSTIKGQVESARQAGLKSRYWDTPSWPVGWRNRVWENLMELGADVLNVDDLIGAARWDWEMCVVGGVNICNS